MPPQNYLVKCLSMLNALIIFAAQDLYLLVILLAAGFFFSLPRERQKSFAVLALIALPCIYAASRLAAHLYFDPRPFVAGHFTPLIPHAPDNGFVSDHALLTGAVSSVVFLFNKKIGGVLWLLTALIGAARVAAGVHHAVDIFGAVAISIAVTAAIYLILKTRKIFFYRRYFVNSR